MERWLAQGPKRDSLACMIRFFRLKDMILCIFLFENFRQIPAAMTVDGLLGYVFLSHGVQGFETLPACLRPGVFIGMVIMGGRKERDK